MIDPDLIWDGVAFNQARLLWSLRSKLTVLLRTGISLSCRTQVPRRWEAGLRRPTGGFNPMEHLSEFLQHTGHESPTTLLARPIVNVCCFLLLLLLPSPTTKQSKHRSDLSLL